MGFTAMNKTGTKGLAPTQRTPEPRQRELSVYYERKGNTYWNVRVRELPEVKA